jgi:DNA-binding SARP family transcriptional activator/TolB-like protein/lipoprotein NlpI
VVYSNEFRVAFMRVAINLFGPFQVLVDGVPIDEAQWGRRKSKTLIKLLALQPLRQSSRQMHREELIELLWPGQDLEQGLNNFHKALHAARRALEPGLSAGASSRFLQLKDRLLILQSTGEISVDVYEFEARAEEAMKTGARDRIEAALAIYQGELLPEDLYEDWTAVRREQLRSQKEQLLLRLAVVCEASADTLQAIETYKQLVASNPCNEAAHRGLMRLYPAIGQRHLGLEQFRVATEILRRELGVEPEPVTVQLYQRILAGACESEAAPITSATEAPASVRPQGAANTERASATGELKQAPTFWYAATAIVMVGLCALAAYHAMGLSARVKSIAVMPLTVAAGSPELDYVADGITESVINDLSRLRLVRVMARSTVYSYQAKGMSPMAAASEMKVHAVLTGTIAKRGDNVLVAAELVGVPEGTRLWGNRYELTAKELISIQDRIASAVATSLGLRLSRDDLERLSPPHPTDPAAYRLYLQARYFWNQRSKEGYLKSIELFQAAISRDPAYARAYAGLSDSYSFLGRDEAPTREYMPRARAAAERALAIDDKLGEAHASLAMMSSVYEWNFQAAEREFQKALELDPGYADAHLLYGVFLASRGDFEHSQSQLDQAAELDPLSPIIALCRGYPSSYQGHVEAAIQSAKEALEISPSFPAAHEDLMNYFERQGRQEASLQQAVALLHARAQHDLADIVQTAYRQSGYQTALRTWLEIEEQRAAKEYVSPLRIALLAIRIDNLDKAFVWLSRAVEDRNAGLVYLTVDPKYARLRSDPRFPGLVARVGLKQLTR